MKENNGVSRLVWNTLIGLVIIVGGILIIANKSAFISIVMVIGGIVAVLEGIYTIVGLFRWHFHGATKGLAIVKGILMVALGAFAVCAPFAAGEALFTTYLYVFAIGLILSAVVAVQNAYVLHKINAAMPVSGFAWEALIDVIIAVVLFTKPTEIMGIAVTVIGIVAIGFGLGTIIVGFRAYKLYKAIKN